jgi:hypothetical protein
MSVPFWNVERGQSGPDYATNPWDTCTLNGMKVPGIVTVTVTPREKIDVQKPNGADGGAFIRRGHEPAKVEINVKIWTPNQWKLWQVVLKAIWRQPGKPARQDKPGQAKAAVKEIGAIRISHPACDLYSVGSVVIAEPGSPNLAERGFMNQKIQALEYLAPKKGATRKTKGAKVPLTPEFEQAKNAIGPLVSETDAVPSLSSPVPGFSSATQ